MCVILVFALISNQLPQGEVMLLGTLLSILDGTQGMRYFWKYQTPCISRFFLYDKTAAVA